MKFMVGMYSIKLTELDNKLSIKIKGRNKEEVEMLSMGETINFNNRAIYIIKGFEGVSYFKTKIKQLSNYIVGFEQKNSGEIEIWYTKLDATNTAFISRKQINGEALTIAMSKEVK